MANSLEARSPLLDHQFLELTAKIPSGLKLKEQNKKYIFKKALETILPKEVLYRKKMGFGLPIEIWFKNELKDYIYQILLGEKFLSRGIFEKNGIKKIIDNHIQKKENNAYQIWTLLFMEHWFREYFD
jgi:asparagine synthase (glutamine-hydrolysing)